MGYGETIPNTAVAAQNADAAFAAGLATLGSVPSQLFFIDPENVADWIRSANAHGFAAAVVRAVDQFLRGLLLPTPAHAAPLCFTCNRADAGGLLSILRQA